MSFADQNSPEGKGAMFIYVTYLWPKEDVTQMYFFVFAFLEQQEFIN